MRLTSELLARWKDLPDSAYLDSADMRKLLGVKHLGATVANKLLPPASHRHKMASAVYRYKERVVWPVSDRFSRTNTKMYWNLGTLRAFVKEKS